jgi:hypothetical protein
MLRRPTAIGRPRKNKARHGCNFSGETRGNSGRLPRGLSPDRKRLRWSDHHEVNILEGAEVNCLLEHEPSSFIAMVDEPEDPEEPSPGSTGPPPPGQAPSDVDSDMEEASVSSADDSMPGLISESDFEDELDHEIATLARHRRPPRQVPVVRAGRLYAVVVFSSSITWNKFYRTPRIPDHVESVKVYATPCRVDLSPEIVEVSSSTESHCLWLR